MGGSAGVVVGAVLGALLSPVVAEVWAWMTSRRGQFSRYWNEYIPEDDERPDRHDVVLCRQRGSRISGEIFRVWPPEERGKRWRFDGHVAGNELVAVFVPNTSHRDQSSFGSIVLHRSIKAMSTEWGAFTSVLAAILATLWLEVPTWIRTIWCGLGWMRGFCGLAWQSFGGGGSSWRWSTARDDHDAPLCA